MGGVQTLTKDITTKGIIDLGENHEYRYIDTSGIPDKPLNEVLAPYSDFVSLSENSLTLQAGVKYPLTLKRRVTTSDTGTNNNSLYFEPSSAIKNV